MDNPAATTNNTALIMLGTGTPNADPNRNGPAIAIIVNDQPYLFDCGAGVVRQAAAAGIACSHLDRVFITHLHSDHTIGLADVLLTPAVMGRPGPLHAIGPPGLNSMASHIRSAYDEDIAERVQGREQGNAAAYAFNIIEIATVPSEVYRDEHVRVVAFPVTHGSWKNAFGYRIETADRIIVFSGDTVPHDSLITHAQGCDVLVHEVYAHDALAQRSERWQNYHRHAHTSSIELAAIAQKVQPRMLVLTHVLLFGASPDELLNEIRDAGYNGDICFANDLDVF